MRQEIVKSIGYGDLSFIFRDDRGFKSLDCSNRKISVENISQVFLVMITRNITSLDLSDNNLDVEAVRIICDKLTKPIYSDHLKHINLSNNPLIGDEGLILIEQMLLRNGNVKSIELCGIGASNDAIFFLTQILKKNNTLQNVVLGDKKIAPDQGVVLVENFRKEMNKILAEKIEGGVRTALDKIAIKYFQATSTLPVGDFLKRSMSERDGRFESVAGVVTHLNYYDRNIEHSKDVAAFLKQDLTPAVRSIDFSCNHLKHSSAKVFAKILERNVKIEHLDLMSNAIGDKGAALISDIFASNKTLRYLNVSRNRMTAKGVVAFFDAIGKGALLETLIIGGSSVSVAELEGTSVLSPVQEDQEVKMPADAESSSHRGIVFELKEALKKNPDSPLIKCCVLYSDKKGKLREYECDIDKLREYAEHENLLEGFDGIDIDEYKIALTEEVLGAVKVSYNEDFEAIEDKDGKIGLAADIDYRSVINDEDDVDFERRKFVAKIHHSTLPKFDIKDFRKQNRSASSAGEVVNDSDALDVSAANQDRSAANDSGHQDASCDFSGTDILTSEKQQSKSFSAESASHILFEGDEDIKRARRDSVVDKGEGEPSTSFTPRRSFPVSRISEAAVMLQECGGSNLSSATTGRY